MITAAEMIEQLRKLPPSMPVVVTDNGTYRNPLVFVSLAKPVGPVGSKPRQWEKTIGERTDADVEVALIA